MTIANIKETNVTMTIANIKETVRSVSKERGQHGIKGKIKL